MYSKIYRNYSLGITNLKILKLIRPLPVSFEAYITGQLKVIGLKHFESADCIVKEQMSYSEWIKTSKQYKTVKVEGLENKLINPITNLRIIDIHLFLNQKSTFSFKWHKDNVNVFLYVVKGFKKVYIKNCKYTVGAGQGVIIPKNSLHKVFSKKNTWALSIGFN